MAHYGSQSPDGVDAIQIEIGQMRTTQTLKVANDLADAIAGFYLAYVKAPDRAAPRRSPPDK